MSSDLYHTTHPKKKKEMMEEEKEMMMKKKKVRYFSYIAKENEECENSSEVAYL